MQRQRDWGSQDGFGYRSPGLKEFPITIQGMGHCMRLMVHPQMSMDEVMYMIVARGGPPMAKQCLMIRGKIISHDTRLA